MIEAIKFTRGAVAKKDYVAELTHFRIAQGRITGFNGMMALSAPINIDLDVRPKADMFAKAVHACEGTMAMHITPTGRLSIKSGKFKALVECLAEEHAATPYEPAGWPVDMGPRFMDSIRALAPFTGVDASRPWAMGIMLQGQSAYATNNVIFAEYWHGHAMPFPMNIPKEVITELLRINEDPVQVLATENSITFHFSGDRWLRSSLYSANWPEQAFKLFDMHKFQYEPTPDGLFDALNRLKPFLDKETRVYFRDGGVATANHEEVGGAHIEVDDLIEGPAFSYQALMLLEGVTHIDFMPHPKPCGFLAEGMRGMILGIRV